MTANAATAVSNHNHQERSFTMTANAATVSLAAGPVIDGKTLKRVDLRRPQAGELRGLQLTLILQMDVNAMFSLLPRITTPRLDQVALEKLTAEDLTALSAEVCGFFTGSATAEPSATT